MNNLVNNFVSEEIYIEDMKRYQNDKILAKNILKNDILNAKKNNIKYEDFKNKYRPSGDDTYIKELWDTLDSYYLDDWIIVLS